MSRKRFDEYYAARSNVICREADKGAARVLVAFLACSAVAAGRGVPEAFLVAPLRFGPRFGCFFVLGAPLQHGIGC